MSKPVLKRKYAKWGYIFSIPFVAAFLAFHAYPFIYQFLIAFSNMKGAGKTTIEFLPFNSPKDGSPFYFLENFRFVLTSKSFWKSFANTWILWLMSVVFELGFAFLFAAWYTDRKFKIKSLFFRIVYAFPNFIAPIVVGTIALKMSDHLNPWINDVMTTIYGWFGLQWKTMNLMYDEWPTKSYVAFINFYMWFGYQTILTTVSMASINKELYEAAELDGANRVQTFFKISLPCIRPMLIFILISSILGGLNMYDVPLLFGGGGTSNSVLTPMVWLYRQGFTGTYNYNRASATALILGSIGICLSLVMFYVLRDRDEERLKKIIRRERRESKQRY